MVSRTEVAEAIAILTGGRALQVGTREYRAFRALSAGGQARTAGSLALRGGKFVGRQAVTKNPWGVAAVLAYEGYIHRDEIADLANALGGDIEDVLTKGGPTGIVKKRTISKANRAVKYAMGVLKAGPKASTGADKGKLAKGSFKLATVAAGLANPNTPSRISKGKSKIKMLARKIRSWW